MQAQRRISHVDVGIPEAKEPDYAVYWMSLTRPWKLKNCWSTKAR
jgi:hypothetical protein